MRGYWLELWSWVRSAIWVVVMFTLYMAGAAAIIVFIGSFFYPISPMSETRWVAFLAAPLCAWAAFTFDYFFEGRGRS